MEITTALILVFAVGLGFVLGRVFPGTKAAPVANPEAISHIYIQGLNYLLNERNDEAIEIFLDALQQHPETVDILLALGRLFRRRGELERALRVHQYLFEQKALSPSVRESILFEIAQDYLKAGILDRAESMLRELLAARPQHLEGLAALAELYELEGDWEQAIGVRERLHAAGQLEQKAIIAMLYCELAEQALAQAKLERAGEYLAAARKEDRSSPRAVVVAGTIAYRQQRWLAAAQTWATLLEGEAKVIILVVLDLLLAALRQCGDVPEARRISARLKHLCRSPLGVDRLANALLHGEGKQAAAAFLLSVIQLAPDLSAIQTLLKMDGEDPAPLLYPALVQAVRALPVNPPLFSCQVCGYQSPQHYWRCPSCRRWGTFAGAGSL